MSFHGSGELVDGNEIGELHSAVKRCGPITQITESAQSLQERNWLDIHHPESTLKLLSSGISDRKFI